MSNETCSGCQGVNTCQTCNNCETCVTAHNDRFGQSMNISSFSTASKEQTIGAVITAEQWNSIRASMNSAKSTGGVGTITAPTVASGDTITADLFESLISSAASLKATTTSAPKAPSAGDSITASYINEVSTFLSSSSYNDNHNCIDCHLCNLCDSANCGSCDGSCQRRDYTTCSSDD